MPDEERGKSNYHTHALARGLLVLETVAARRDPATLTEIHESSGLPKSTIVRLLSALVDEEYLVRVDDRPSYRLGHKVMSLAHAFVDSLSVPDLARPYLVTLAAETRQTANLAVLDGVNVIHVAVEHPVRPLRYDASVGDRAVTYGTGLGKVLLAALPEARGGRPPAAATLGPVHPHDDHEPGAAHLGHRRRHGRRGMPTTTRSGTGGCAASPSPSRSTAPRSRRSASPERPASSPTRSGRRFLELLRSTAAALASDRTIVAALTSAPSPRG